MSDRTGGPWTSHGHAVDGVTVHGTGRPSVARCGGPGMCAECSIEADRIREQAAPAAPEPDLMVYGIPLDKPGLYFTAGDGSLVHLDWEVPHGGNLSMTPRQRALALALLEFGRRNVEQAADDAAWGITATAVSP